MMASSNGASAAQSFIDSQDQSTKTVISGVDCGYEDIVYADIEVHADDAGGVGGSGGDGEHKGGANAIERGLLIPPLNFAMVDDGVFRSGYPHTNNLPFLQTLNLCSIVYLCPEPYPPFFTSFVKAHNIKLFHHGIQGTKEPFVDIPDNVIRAALTIILDKKNRPVLVHCRKGKHRTGCLIGCYRKAHNYTLTHIFDEYQRHAGPKARVSDQQFIELFNASPLRHLNSSSDIAIGASSSPTRDSRGPPYACSHVECQTHHISALHQSEELFCKLLDLTSLIVPKLTQFNFLFPRESEVFLGPHDAHHQVHLQHNSYTSR